MKPFRHGPVSFRYPADWELTAEQDGPAWTAHVESPGTAFFIASVRPELDDAAALAEETLATLRAEFKELDAEPVVVSLGGWPAVGHDVDFLTVDTPTLCLTRCVNTTAGPVLFWAQVSEFDRDDAEPVLRAMLDSVTITDEE